jgi:hypothetical protein
MRGILREIHGIVVVFNICKEGGNLSIGFIDYAENPDDKDYCHWDYNH